MYYYYFHKTPSMILKRVIVILGASFEFHVKRYFEIQERPNGNKEIHMLFKVLPQLNEKNQERTFCFSYSVKSRALMHARLTRLSLSPQTLEKDSLEVIRKCPTLIQEMCVCFGKLMMLAHAGQISKMPHLFSLENTMKLCPMIVQALWDHKNPLLQLPHIDGDILKYINSKYHLKTLEQFVRLDKGDKSKCLRSLTEDTMRVFSTLDEWLAIALIPTTYIFRPQKRTKDHEKKIKECNCDGCQIKDGFLTKPKLSNIFRQYVIQSMLVFGWLLMIFAFYRTQQFDHEYASFDAYNIFGLDIGASNADIKTAYKTKALVYHPDK
ncbi:hypothetical protein QYM36_013245 [Artemia franciscana]|uniref:J domain-containing protein n=1 Tax=Artemia franciscana TaxID=6661 RepID=A0AA88L145_ARTSF|nr:hypothetical protein QYM36_013245 [Artemia franciscana]